MTNDQIPMTNDCGEPLFIGAWSLDILTRPGRAAAALDVVYQMRNQLCQLLLEEPENLFGALQAAVGGKLLQAKSPVEDRMSPKISHRALNRMGSPMQKFPVGCVDGPANL